MIHPLSLATDGFISASDIQIDQPVISNLSRTNATGSVDISVADEALITKVWATCDFGALSGQVGELTGSGTLTLDFSGCTLTITLGGLTVNIAAPISRLFFQTRDGNGNFSEMLVVQLCDGIGISNKIVITNYLRNGASATFHVSGLAGTSADAGAVIWNDGTNTLTGQVITNGTNTITGLDPLKSYSFMPIYHAADGTFIVIPSQFGDVVSVYTGSNILTLTHLPVRYRIPVNGRGDTVRLKLSQTDQLGKIRINKIEVEYLTPRVLKK